MFENSAFDWFGEDEPNFDEHIFQVTGSTTFLFLDILICVARRAAPSEVWKKHWMPVMRKIAKKQRHQVFAQRHSLEDGAEMSRRWFLSKHLSVSWDDESLRLASEGEYHGNPQPSFLGVITHNLGCKTFIFHGFGVQRYMVHRDAYRSQTEINLFFCPESWDFHLVKKSPPCFCSDFWGIFSEFPRCSMGLVYLPTWKTLKLPKCREIGHTLSIWVCNKFWRATTWDDFPEKLLPKNRS